MKTEENKMSEIERQLSDIAANKLAQLLIEKRRFEEWARSHGKLSLERAGLSASTRKGLFPSCYLEDETEVAWRSWANKPAAPAQEPLADLLIEVADVLAGQNWRGDLVEALRDAAQPAQAPKS
jgi:hypothetical protein